MTLEQKEAAEGGFWSEVAFGFRYIFKRPSLLGLQTVFMLGNFFVTISFALVVPMILARTGNNGQVLGWVQAIGAAGGIVGGIIISAWGGFKRRVHGVLIGWIISGLSTVLIGFGRGDTMWSNLVFWGGGFFIGAFVIPLVNGSNQGIWQAKVSPDIQGKVFSIRRLIAWVVTPLARFIAGPLADFGLEPAMREGGAFADTFSWLVGTGPGSGMSLTYFFTGVLAVLIGLAGYFVPYVRNAEDLLPDHGMDAGAVEPAEDIDTSN
jgi:hypothetical protein